MTCDPSSILLPFLLCLFFESILDADNDGSIIDDVAEVISGKKKNGIAGVFGKLFNKN